MTPENDKSTRNLVSDLRDDVLIVLVFEQRWRGQLSCQEEEWRFGHLSGRSIIIFSEQFQS